MRSFAEIEALRNSLKSNPKKSCDGCTACCSSVPVRELGLRAWERCAHVRSFPHAHPGCAIYPQRPHSCQVWNCGWRIADWGEDADLRPDRCGVIVDPMDDLVWLNGKELPVVRFWVLPGHEDDYIRQPVLALVMAVLDDATTAVLWDMAPNAAGQRLARVIFKHDGQLSITKPAASQNTGMTEADRFWRAHDLQRE